MPEFDEPAADPSGTSAGISTGIAAELIRLIPALRDLADLSQTAGRLTSRGGEISFDLDSVLSLDVVERAYVLHVLGQFGGNKTQAAEALGLDPSTLYRKLHRWGIT